MNFHILSVKPTKYTSFDYNYQNAFVKNHLCDTNLHYKDCSEMHSDHGCSKICQNNSIGAAPSVKGIY